MKIFIINNYCPEEVIGGSEIQCWLLAKYLAKRGHRTFYLAVQGLAGQKKEKGEGFKTYYLSSKNENRLKGFVNFYRLLKKEKPDICYIRTFRYLFFLSLICRILKIPAVFNTSNINDCDPHLEKIEFSSNPLNFLKSVQSYILRRLNFTTLKKIPLITITKYHPRLLKEKYKIEVRALPIYNFMEDEYKKNKARKQRQIVWVNNLKPRKNPEAFIKLAEYFKNSDYRFLMIGRIQSNPDYYQKTIKETEKRLPNFKYLGGKSIAEVNKILASSQILVNTCHPEGFGNNFIQAWFNKCPTITLYFDPDNIIVSNKIGFHSQTFAKMVEDLKTLMTNENPRNEMAERAREYALENHSISNVKKYEERFKEIINEELIKKD